MFHRAIHKMFAISALPGVFYLEIFLWNIVSSEWIDMPQFSDEKKVYRMPSPKQDHFYKFVAESAEKQFAYGYQDVTFKNLKIERTTVNESAEHVFDNVVDIITEATINEDLDEKTAFEFSSENYDEVPMSSNIEEEEVNEKYFNETLISNNTEILNYLPVDILKNVHRILKSQPSSSEGKFEFLKSFEKTLMSEIESRIVETITNGREKRGADHYEHGSDYHDHPMGFPSIEGALMAISFLTFAVYLVRLVMLLFRNMNNSSMNNNMNMNGALLLGRRKRSENRFDYDMTNILNAVDNFSTAL